MSEERYYETTVRVILDLESPLFTRLEARAKKEGWTLAQTISMCAEVRIHHHIEKKSELPGFCGCTTEERGRFGVTDYGVLKSLRR